MADFGEHERWAVHESGHCLLHTLLWGDPGKVMMEKNGAGVCRLTWGMNPDLELRDEDACYYLDAVLNSQAGQEAEKLVYGAANIMGCSLDIQLGSKAWQQIRRTPALRDDPAFHIFDASRAQQLVRSLLRQHQRPLKAAASRMRTDTPSAETKNWLRQYDSSGLSAFFTMPIFADDDDWRRRWARLREDVGLAYAIGWANTPHPRRR